MTPLFVSASVRLYRVLALLYPAAWRLRWEAEMIDTFTLQLADAVHGRRWRRAAGIWCYTFAELFAIALPLRMGEAAVVVPLAAVTGATAVFYGMLWALENSLQLSALYHHTIGKFGG